MARVPGFAAFLLEFKLVVQRVRQETEVITIKIYLTCYSSIVGSRL